MVSTLSIVLFLVLGTAIHQSEAAPKVRIEKDAPPSVTLICDNIPTSSHVEWKKDDGLLDENARYKEMFSDRLEISPVYREDKGSFTCEVDGDQSEPVFLELFPSKPFIKPSTYGMQMGSSLSLECRDVSPETARVIWKRDGHIVANNLTSFSNLSRSNSDITGFRLSDDGHTLIFDNLSRSDNGIYNCMVKTPYGSSSSEDFSVDTAYGPLDVTVCVHISTGEEHCSTSNKPSKPVPILSSTSFTLNCTFDSKPHKDHKWKVPDGKVKTRQIEVKQPRKADSGPYTCEVWNEVTGKGANVSISIVVWGSTGVRCMALYGPTKRRLQCSLPNGTEQTLRFEASKGDSDYCVVTNSSPGSCPCFTANRNATCPVAQCEEPETRLRHLCTFNVYLASRVGGRETKVLSEFDPTHNVVPPAPHSVTIQDGMVTWKSPAAVYLTKYNFQVDFRKLPDGKWQSKKETSDFLSFVPSNLKLMVRVRARPKDYEGFWSSWSPVVFSQATVPPGGLNVVVPREVGFVDGEDVSLPCTFTLDDNSEPIDLSKLEVEWINGPTILTYRNGKIEPSSWYKDRVMMNEQNLRNGDATLILHHVTEVTMLTCIVTYNGETQSDTVLLSYKLSVHCPEFIVASPGEESTFTCDFSPSSRGVHNFIDSPVFSIEWNKDSNKHPIARFSRIEEHYMDGLRMSVSGVHHGTFSLTFKSVKPDDYGNYTCNVYYPEYTQGSAATALYMGHVMVKSTKTVEVTTGEDSDFIYKFSLDTQEGSPSIDNSLLSIEFHKDSNKNPLYFFQNGEERVLDGRIKISRNPNGDSFILTLKNVEFHHNGTYTCTIRYPNYKEGSTSTILLVRSKAKHQRTFVVVTICFLCAVIFGALVLMECYTKIKRFNQRRKDKTSPENEETIVELKER